MAVNTHCVVGLIKIIPKKKLPVQQLGIIMPTAVIMEENFDKLLDQCETQELEVSIGKQNAHLFSCHG